jgi:hypothetical protein
MVSTLEPNYLLIYCSNGLSPLIMLVGRPDKDEDLLYKASGPNLARICRKGDLKSGWTAPATCSTFCLVVTMHSSAAHHGRRVRLPPCVSLRPPGVGSEPQLTRPHFICLSLGLGSLSLTRALLQCKHGHGRSQAPQPLLSHLRPPSGLANATLSSASSLSAFYSWSPGDSVRSSSSLPLPSPARPPPGRLLPRPAGYRSPLVMPRAPMGVREPWAAAHPSLPPAVPEPSIPELDRALHSEIEGGENANRSFSWVQLWIWLIWIVSLGACLLWFVLWKAQGPNCESVTQVNSAAQCSFSFSFFFYAYYWLKTLENHSKL